MIREIKKKYLLFLSLLLALVHTTWSQYSPTNEIVSNDIYFLAGGGDTLWMLTSKGVNYTTSIIDNSIVWGGFRDLNGWTLTYGGGFTLIRTTKDYSDYYQMGTTSKLWLFNILTKGQTELQLPFNTDTLSDSAVFQASDAVWFNGSFWIACMHGGLVQLNTSNNSMAIFFPGHNSIGYDFNTFLLDSVELLSDSTFTRVVAVDSSHVWLLCRKSLWSFNPADTTWSRVNDSVLTVKEYYDVKLRIRNDTTILYSLVAKYSGNNVDTCVLRYNNATDQWQKFIDDAGDIVALVVGEKNYVYVIDSDNNEIFVYIDSLPDTTIKLQRSFQNRILNAQEDVVGDYTISDIHYAIAGSDTLLQVATDIGLFYSNNEHYDEVNKIPFHYERRNVSLSSALKETYAIPGIFNNRLIVENICSEVVFAYNLSKDDYVTIDIFDYNMDHVLNIFEVRFGTRWQYRKAGKHKTSGRSTIPMYDNWDGTVNNNNGRPVSPGVYFYRIKTKTRKDKPAFGKVIIARN